MTKKLVSILPDFWEYNFTPEALESIEFQEKEIMPKKLNVWRDELNQEDLKYIKLQNENPDINEIAHHIREILILLDQDLSDPNLEGTPDRVANYLYDFLNYDPGNKDVTFPSIQLDQMVIVKNIPAWSLCSHHMLPMKLKVSVGYISVGEVLGLSKIPRIVQTHCHKLQLQEKITDDIAKEVQSLLDDSKDVAVYIESEFHACMEMRGIKSEANMITSVLFGEFQELSVRSEFLSLVKWKEEK